MRTDALLQIAREIVARVPACMAITVDHNGDASARVAGKKALRQYPSYETAYRCLASAHAHLWREAEARDGGCASA